MVAYGCSNHPTAAAVQISVENKNKTKNNAEIRSEKRAQIAAKTEANGQEKVKTETVYNKKVHITAESQEEEMSKKPCKPYQDILAFLKTDEILLFKIKMYKVSVSLSEPS